MSATIQGLLDDPDASTEAKQTRPFKGLLPGTSICVDWFSPGVNASIYFLTHFHADHYVGLSNSWNSGIIYCTETTRLLLRKQFPGIKSSHVRSLAYGTWHMHMIDHTTQIPSRSRPEDAAEEMMEVTVASSHHCPGSCLLIFEGYFGKYVYTGDIRFEEDLESDDAFSVEVDLNLSTDESSIPWSKMSGASRLFMDTTFSHPLWEAFPGRSEAILAILELVSSLPRDTPVLLECEMLGTEPVLVAVSNYFRQPIFAEARVFAKLCSVPGMKQYLTQDRQKSRFMVVQHGTFSHKNLDRATSGAKSMERSIHAMNACHIKPSTQWFGANSVLKTLDVRPIQRDGVWHVLYSIHNSYSETRRFIERIRPQCIVPLVATDSIALQRLESLCTGTSKGNFDTKHEIKIPNRVLTLIGNARSRLSMEISGETKIDPDTIIMEHSSELHRKHARRLSAEEIIRQEDHLNDQDDEDSINLSLYEFLQEKDIHLKQRDSTLQESPLKTETMDPCKWSNLNGSNGTPMKTLFDDSFSEEISQPPTALPPLPIAVPSQVKASKSTEEPEKPKEIPEDKKRMPTTTVESIFEILLSEPQITQHLIPSPKKRCIEIIEIESDEDEVTIFDLVYDLDAE